eukprot:8360146-Alexandrium_andersonii.AAC.1
MLDLPFELAHTLRHGCDAQGIGSLEGLLEAVWRHRGGPPEAEGAVVLFPRDVDRPFLQALGLGPEG